PRRRKLSFWWSLSSPPATRQKKARTQPGYFYAFRFSSAILCDPRPLLSHISSISSQLRRVTLRSISIASCGSVLPVVARTQAFIIRISRTRGHDLASDLPSVQSPGGGSLSTQREYTGQPHTRQ